MFRQTLTDLDIFGKRHRQDISCSRSVLFSMFYLGLGAWNKIDDDDDDEKTSRWCAVSLYAVTCHPCLQSATPFHCRLRTCHGTDGQTDDSPQRL